MCTCCEGLGKHKCSWRRSSSHCLWDGLMFKSYQLIFPCVHSSVTLFQQPVVRQWSLLSFENSSTTRLDSCSMRCISRTSKAFFLAQSTWLFSTTLQTSKFRRSSHIFLMFFGQVEGVYTQTDSSACILEKAQAKFTASFPVICLARSSASRTIHLMASSQGSWQHKRSILCNFWSENDHLLFSWEINIFRLTLKISYSHVDPHLGNLGQGPGNNRKLRGRQCGTRLRLSHRHIQRCHGRNARVLPTAVPQIMLKLPKLTLAASGAVSSFARDQARAARSLPINSGTRTDTLAGNPIVSSSFACPRNSHDTRWSKGPKGQVIGGDNLSWSFLSNLSQSPSLQVRGFSKNNTILTLLVPTPNISCNLPNDHILTYIFCI